MAIQGEPRERGLPSLNESRRRRRRAIVLGRVAVREAAPYMWLWIFAVIAAFGVIYWRWAEGQLINQKAAAMAKQRAIASTLGPTIHPFLSRIEAWTQELAGPWRSDQIEWGGDFGKLASSGGVYLRLHIDEARSPEAIQTAATKSVRDGVTACLFAQARAHDPSVGEPCKAISDCPSGKLCNEYSVCTPPEQPFNLRMAYRALRVLSPKWTDDLHQAKNDLSVRVFELDLEKASRHDVPLAIELLTRSDYFTLVLDEPGAPDAKDDLAPGETPAEQLQRLEHPVRVGVWDLKRGTKILALRTLAAGRAVAVGEQAVTDPRTVAAQQRQVNNCAIALAVKEKLGTQP